MKKQGSETRSSTPVKTRGPEGVENLDSDWKTKCTVCGRELTWDEAYYTNDQNLFDRRFVCFKCGM